MFVRVHPKTWYGWISMRIELFGCSGRTPVIRRFSIEYVVNLSIGREIPRTWIYINIRMSILPFFKKKATKVSAPCEDRTHDLQISTLNYETDALPTALTRHLLRYTIFFLLPINVLN